MASIIKRNKNLINKVSKTVVDCYPKMMGDSYYKREFIKYMFTNGIELTKYFQFYIGPKYNKVIAVEGKNKIYIGFDTSRVGKLDFAHYDDLFYGVCHSVYTLIKDSVEKYTRYDRESIIVDTLKKNGDMDSIKFESYGWYDEDSGTIEQTILYSDVVDSYYKELNNTKFSLELRDGLYKEINNRKFIPVIIIDLDKQELNYCTSPYSDTERKQRNSVSIETYMSTGDRDFRSIIEIPISNMMEVKAEGSNKLRVEQI